MKRFIAILVLLLSLSMSAFAQKNTVSGSMIINTTDVIKTKKVFAKAKVERGFEQEASFAWSALWDGPIHHININYIGGFRFNHYLFVGVGSGLDFGAGYSFKPHVMEDGRYVSSSCTEVFNLVVYDLPIQKLSIPLYAHFKVYFMKTRLAPFLAFSGGMRFSGAKKLEVTVHGKLDGTFPLYHEFNSDVVLDGFNKLLNFKQGNDLKYSSSLEKLQEDIPSRAPVLCAGCPHRAMYYGINKAIEELGLKTDDVVFASDIGCYTLGINPPYNAADYLLSMGSSVGDGCGFSVSTDQKVASFIGDSTFFHSGISPLINAVHNKHNFVLTVLDNRITAMTGGQPNPGIPIDGMGDEAPEVSIRKLALACGCDYVRVINPFNLEQVVKTYKEAFERNDTAVIVFIPPAVPTGEPPINIKIIHTITD